MSSIIPVRPWRLLVLDRDPDDPKWLLATVSLRASVRPADLRRDSTCADWPEIRRWAAGVLGHPVILDPLADPLAWSVADATLRPR